MTHHGNLTYTLLIDPGIGTVLELVAGSSKGQVPQILWMNNAKASKAPHRCGSRSASGHVRSIEVGGPADRFTIGVVAGPHLRCGLVGAPYRKSSMLAMAVAPG